MRILQAYRVDTDNIDIWRDVVPFNIRGKLMDYAHHNLQLHHFGYQQTLDSIQHRYYWATMEQDIKLHCETCLSCQFVKGSVRHRAPLRIRQLPKRREHIFVDFLGPIFGKYYIMVIVDYATGYTMLVPALGCDGVTVLESLLSDWIPVFGWFKTLETDWGSGFNNKLLKSLTTTGIKHTCADQRLLNDKLSNIKFIN